MKLHREVKETETRRKSRGVRIMGQKSPQTPRKEDASMSAALAQVSSLHLYYQVGKVYAFTVSGCFSDQKADGTQHTRYVVRDKRESAHDYYCDCTCFKVTQEILLRIKKICYNRLEFETNVIERYDEIFTKGEEYEFEVISYQNENGRYVVCDTQIGKNHYLRANHSKLYKQCEKLKLEVQGFDDKGNLLLVDRNPPTPEEPGINPMQLLAESMEKSQNKEIPPFHPKQQLPQSVLRQTNQSNSSDTPKVAPSIAIPREDKRVLVEDLGYKMPKKSEKHVPGTSAPKPVYTRSIKQPQVKPKSEPQLEPKIEPQPVSDSHSKAKQNQEMRYEQIVESVKKLNCIEQFRLAKVCLEAAAEQQHYKAKLLLEKWDAGGESGRKEDSPTETKIWSSQAPETCNSEVELMDWGTLVCGQEATDVCLPDDTKETEESTLEYEALAQEVLPPDENHIAESGHSPSEETEVHHVASPPPEPIAAEAAPASCGWWSMILNFFTGKRRCKGK